MSCSGVWRGFVIGGFPMRRRFRALAGLLVLAGVLAVAPAASAVPERGSVGDVVVAASVPGVLAVSWSAPTDPAGEVPTDYRVRWAAVGDPYLTWSDLSGNAFPNATSLDIGDLTVGVAYRVQVRARYRSGRFESAAWSGPWAESDPATVTDTYVPSVVLEGSMGVGAGLHGGGAMVGYAKWGSGTGTPVGTFDAPRLATLVRLEGTHTLLGRTGLVDPVAFGFRTRIGAPFIVDAGGRLFSSTQAVVQETLAGAGAYWWIWDNQCAHWNPGDTITVQVETLDRQDTRLEPPNTTLNTLTLDGATLNDTFDPDTADYTATTDADTEQVTIEATAADTNACTVDISPADADTDTDGHQINLDEVAQDETSATTDITVTVTAPGGATRAYQIAINRPAPPSDDATLATLAITDTDNAAVLLTPAFDADTLAYTAQAAADTEQITITATTADADATAHIAPADADTETDGHQIDVAEGTPTAVTVTVTAADTTTTQAYEVAVSRDAHTPAAAASAGLDIAPGWSLDPATKRYRITPRRGATSGRLTMTPVSGSDLEAFTVDASLRTRQIGTNGLARLSPSADTILFIRASSGPRETLYTVRLRPPAAANWRTANQRTAPNNKGGGWTTTITTRTNHEPTLSALAVSPGTLDPAFAAATHTYTVDVAHDVEHLTVSPTAAGTATYTITPADADTNTAGHQIALAAATGTDPAETTIAIALSEGTNMASYTITAKRAAPPPVPFGLIQSGRFNISQDHPNLRPSGLWSDGTSMWIGHHRHRRTFPRTSLYYETSQYCKYESNDTRISVFNLETGSRESGRDIQVGCDVNALWSDGETLYAAAWNARLSAYDLVTQTPQTELDVWVLYGIEDWRSHAVWSDGETFWSIYVGRFSTELGPFEDCRVFCLVAHYRGPVFYNVFPSSEVALSETSVDKSTRGLWSDGRTMWIAHQGLGHLIAYDMETGERKESLDFETLAAAGVGEPSGMWSDGRTMFVADNEDRAIYEFKMPALPVLHSLELSGVDIGHFRLSKYGYTAEVANTVTSTTVTAVAAASSSTVAILPADSDTTTEGHQVALSVGANEITVTVTEGTDTRTYTVTITRQS